MRKIYFLLFTLFSFFAATQSSQAQYCNVTFPSAVEPITLVTFNTINNATSATVGGTPALENFTAQTTNIFKTISYPITVKGNTDGNFTTIVNVFFDWNQDQDFLDAGETFPVGNIVNSTGLDAVQATANILVPAGALDGNTRMRVMKRFSAAGASCNTTGFGQAEDYTVNVQTLPPCVTPPGPGTTVGPTGTICPGASFNLTITGGSFGVGITYQWEFSTDNTNWFNVPAATSASLTTTATTNTWYRRKITCSGVDAFSNGVLVTLAGAQSIPFTETFSGYATLFPPPCWSNNNATYLGGFAPSAFGIGSGSARFRFYLAPNGANLDLTTRPFTAVPANHRLTFDHAYATFSGENDQLQIQYSTDGGASFTTLITYNGGAAGPLNTAGTMTGELTAPTAAQWASKSIALPTGTNVLRFRGIAAFGNNLFVDNVTVEPTPPCLPPTGLTTTASGPTTATLSWTAASPAPANGYQWEIRSSGAPGSGATGLAASGVTAAGVTTANATGLTPNTTYSYYVRSDCAGTFSSWTLAFVFATPCNAIAIPFTETFAGAFPPSCWTRSNTTLLVGSTASAYGAGTGSASYDFYSTPSGANLDLISPLFTAVPANYRVTFDHAYATFLGENDRLEIFYSTNGGATYTSLINYNGGTGGPLNTGGASTPEFTPGASQWLNKAVALPTGTNRLRFRGISAFGNNLFLDNITVELTPSCLPATQVSALSVSPTSVIVNFTPGITGPTVGYIVEYGTTGFVPGTGATAGGGTLAFGATSPITVSGLTAGTNYDFYVRRICIAAVDYSVNVKTSATTLCAATNVPYLQDFETSTPLVGFPTCTSMQDVNGNSGPTPNSGGGRFITNNVATTYRSPTNSLWYIYDVGNPARGGDDWFYLQGLNLTAGTSYRVKAYFKASDGPTWNERFEIKYGTEAINTAMTNLIYTSPIISSNVAGPFDSVMADFTPSGTGVYYIGFHNISAGDQAFLFIDDISVRVSPRVDVGITGLITPTLNCPTSNAIIQATIMNYNTSVQNFATYPVTVTATITGAQTATLTTTINSGTLAPGATMGIYLPAYNFTTPGTYNVTVATSTTPADNDPETGNDAFSTTILINPNPAAPVLSPANPGVCAGNSVQITATQPPASTSVFNGTTGTISLGVPDGVAAGIGSPIAVSGIPTGATVTGITVTVNLSHTWLSDMTVSLRAPNGNSINLFNRKGGSGDNLVTTVFNNTSTTGVPAAGAPYTGTFAPDSALGVGPTATPSNVTNFSGLYSGSLNGNWVLDLRDHVGLDAGTLNNWSIRLNYSYVPALTWTPVSGLFTNSGATTPYTAGASAYSIWANPAATSTYTATATGAGGCSASTNVTVTVNPFPTVIVGSNIPDTVCISDQLIALSGNPAGGSWTGIGVSGSNFIPPSTAVGGYNLTYSYTNQFGCTRTAVKRIVVVDCPERIIQLDDNAVFLYPNPNNGNFNIRMNSVLYNYLGMKVFANNGVLVKTQMLSGLTYGSVVPINLSHLPGGVYMVKFYYDGGVRTSEKTFKVMVGTP